MKRILFLILAMTYFYSASAQTSYTLSGTNYTQTFDGIAGGLPSGWRVDSLVNKNAGLGNDAQFRFSPAQTSWGNATGRGFKNVASSDGLTSASTSTDQNASTDRALSARQVGASGWDDKDSLVAFNFQISNTAGLSAFNLQFKFMTLNLTGGRSNDWIVQYGLGANPTSFTAIATTPALIHADSTFQSGTYTVNFGVALDNKTQPVWIRITPNDTTTGGGSRPLVAIDDFNLSWTGLAVNNVPQIMALTPPDNATGLPAGVTNLSIVFDKNITIGTGNITVYNLSDVTNQVIPAGSANASGMTVNIPGVTLALGKNYAVQFDSTCFQWTTYNCAGIYSNTSWNFSTTTGVLPPQTSLNETFAGCNFPLLDLFTQFSVIGLQNWRCSSFGHTDTSAVYMNGFSSGSLDNEDWLISPPINVSAMTNPNLNFWSKYRFTGTNTKEVFVSSNYSGTGDPTTAIWTNLNVNLSALDTVYGNFKNTDLTSYKGATFFIAFKYVSSSTGTADEWSIDDVNISDGPQSASNFIDNSLKLNVYGTINAGHFFVEYNSKHDDEYALIMTDLVGNIISKKQIHIQTGTNKIEMNLPNLADGMYILSLQNKTSKGSVKIIKQ